MQTSTHLLQLEPATAQRPTERVRVLTGGHPQWGAPLFRAPALPTPHQFNNELPFTVNFPPRLRVTP